jgi:hypothetical protein
MNILFATLGVLGTVVFSAVAFVVFAILIDLFSRKTPSLPLANLTPWLAGLTTFGFAMLEHLSGAAWATDMGWVSLFLTFLALALRQIVRRIAARADL